MSLVLHGGHGKSLFVAHGSIRIVQEQLAERRDKTILIRHISAVEVKKPGSTPHDSTGTFTGGALDAARDENSVTFATLDDYDVALKIKVFVESWTPSAGG